MKSRIFIYLILISITLLGKDINIDIKDRKILLFKDGKGIFLYDIKDKSTNLIIDFKNKNIVVDIEKLIINEDQIKITFYDSEDAFKARYKNKSYKEFEFIITLPSFKFFLSKTIEKSFTDLIIYIKEYDHILFNSHSYSVLNKRDLNSNYEMKTHSIDGITYFSEKGNLYKRNRRNEINLFLEHKEDFSHLSPKFVAGYIDPGLSNDGKKLLFQDTEYEDIKTKQNLFSGLWNFFFGKIRYWIELDLESQKQELYTTENTLIKPKYSFSNRFILFKSPFVSYFNSYHKYFVIDRETKEFFQISKCTVAYWVY